MYTCSAASEVKSGTYFSWQSEKGFRIRLYRVSPVARLITSIGRVFPVYRRRSIPKLFPEDFHGETKHARDRHTDTALGLLSRVWRLTKSVSDNGDAFLSGKNGHSPPHGGKGPLATVTRSPPPPSTTTTTAAAGRVLFQWGTVPWRRARSSGRLYAPLCFSYTRHRRPKASRPRHSVAQLLLGRPRRSRPPHRSRPSADRRICRRLA